MGPGLPFFSVYLTFTRIHNKDFFYLTLQMVKQRIILSRGLRDYANRQSSRRVGYPFDHHALHCCGSFPTDHERGNQELDYFATVMISQNVPTYPKSNQTSKQCKEPKRVRKSCNQAENRNYETREVHGDLSTKLVAERTDCYSAHEEANKNHG